MRGAVETVTLWHKTRENGQDVWERHVIPGVSWEGDILRAVSGNAAAMASTFTVLIPSPAPPVAVGDLMAKGAQEVDITGEGQNTKEQVRNSLLPEVFAVKAVYSGNAAYKRGGHIEVLGV